MKKSKLITIVALTIIISGLLFQGSYYFAKVAHIKQAHQFYRLTQPFLSRLVLDPFEFFYFLFHSNFLKGAYAAGGIGEYIINKNLYTISLMPVILYASLARTLVVIMLAFGIMLRKKMARVLFLIVCWLTVAANLIGIAYFSINEMLVISMRLSALKWFVGACFGVMIPLFYIYCLSPKEIKEQFR